MCLKLKPCIIAIFTLSKSCHYFHIKNMSTWLCDGALEASQKRIPSLSQNAIKALIEDEHKQKSHTLCSIRFYAALIVIDFGFQLS